MKRKLQSQRGAAITFGLLLFLVCAVLGAIVLTAGTAAAGRIAGVAHSDQRYYSVTSAARLFQDQFDGKKCTIERTHTFVRKDTLNVTESGGTYQYTASSVPSATSYDAYNVKLIENGTQVTTVNSLLQQLTCDLVLGNAPLNEPQTGWGKVFPQSESLTADKKVALTVAGQEDLAVDIEVTPSYTFSPGGGAQLDLVFMNHDTQKPQFKMKMTLLADVEKPAYDGTTEIPASSEEVAKTEYNGTKMTVTSNVTETKTTSITWRVVSLEVIGKGNAA